MSRLMLETTRSIPLGDVTEDMWNIAESDNGWTPNSPSIPINPSTPFDWGKLLTTGVNNIATPILNSQFGGPKPGQYFATSGPQGQTVAYNVPQGSNSINAFPGLSVSSGSFGSMLPLLGIGLAGVVLFKLFSK